MSGVHVLRQESRIQIVEAVVSRHSLRSTVRLTGIPQNRVKALLMRLGPACTRYQHETLHDLPVSPFEWREAFAFRAKAGNNAVSHQYSHTTGSVWTLACLDTHTKLVPTWRIGSKSTETLEELRADVAWRYIPAEETPAVSTSCPAAPDDNEELCRACRTWLLGLERGFARKVERHAAVVALYFMYYNFSAVHQELGTTPAIAAGKASHVWRAEEIVELLNVPATTRCSAVSAPTPPKRTGSNSQ
jgi:hypothetical protein